MKWLVVLTILLIRLNASAQMSADGTIIVFNSSKDEIVFASDSRSVFGGISYSDEECKIRAFGNKVLFAASGRGGRRNHFTHAYLWNTNTLARNIFLDATKKGASPNLADQLAGDWGIAMEKQLEKDIAIDRDGTLANTEDGTIALGTVADFEKDGSPLIVQEKIAYEIAGNGSVTSNPLSATGTWAPTIIPATWGRGRLSESSLPARKCARRNGNEILKWEAD